MHHWAISRYLLIALVIYVLAYLSLEFSRLNLMFNLHINDQIAQTTSLDAPQHSVIIETTQNTRHILSTVTPHANQTFWVLADKPLSHEQHALIEEFKINTIKIPVVINNNSGSLRLSEKTSWQPSAGYLLPIPKLFGVNREFVGQYITATSSFDSPTSALGFNLRNHYINFASVPISTAIFNEQQFQTLAEPIRTLKGKNIFLTSQLELEGFNITPPNNEGNIGWHLIQYHAAAIFAAKQARYYSVLPIKINIMTFTGMGILLFLILSSITSKRYFYYSISLNGLLLVTLPIIQQTLNLLPNITELILCLGVFNFIQLKQKHSHLQHTLVDLNSQIKQSIQPSLLEHKIDNDFWLDITNLVTQSLNLQKSIFLQKVKKDHRLKEISAFNCQLDDINEMRRDYEREPYLSAIKKRRCISPNRKYFKHVDPEEIELIVPFIKNDQVMGFWALTIISPKSNNIINLISIIELFAKKISSLIYQKQLSETNKQNPLANFLKSKKNSMCEKELNHSVGALLESQNFFRQIFYTMNDAAIVFDLFGHVLEVNTSMERLAQRYQIQLFDNNAFHFLKQFMKESEDSIRHIFRHLTLNNSAEQYTTIVNLHGSAYILTLSTLLSDSENKLKKDITSSGLMCEFFDMGELVNHQTIERGLYNNYLEKMKNSLSAIQLSILQMEQRIDDPELTYLHYLIQNKLEQSAKLTIGTHYFLNEVTKARNDSSIPFSPQQILSDEIESIITVSKQNRIELNIEKKFTGQSLCIGQVQRFRQLISSLLKLLAEDCVVPKSICIQSKYVTLKHGSYIYLKITNTGYGVSNSFLEQLKNHEVQDISSLLGNCLHFISFFNQDNNICRLKTKIGEGYRISFVLPGIDFDE